MRAVASALSSRWRNALSHHLPSSNAFLLSVNEQTCQPVALLAPLLRRRRFDFTFSPYRFPSDSASWPFLAFSSPYPLPNWVTPTWRIHGVLHIDKGRLGVVKYVPIYPVCSHNTIAKYVRTVEPP